MKGSRHRSGVARGLLVCGLAGGFLTTGVAEEWSLSPREALAQGAGSRPAVVPRRDAYLEEAAPASPEALLRWDTGPGEIRILRVFFEPPPEERPDFWRAAEAALEVWAGVPGLPIRFHIVETADHADVRFRWVERFSTKQAGTTDRETAGGGHLLRATVTIALQHAEGLPMSDEFLRFVALHELGHVLGLPHSGDPGDVMHPGNRNVRLSERDVRSVQRLYEHGS